MARSQESPLILCEIQLFTSERVSIDPACLWKERSVKRGEHCIFRNFTADVTVLVRIKILLKHVLVSVEY
jgi:hypothetical protein